MPRAKMVCPKHGVPLERSSTRYGARYDCMCEGCTVMCWAGRTSTPADLPTRKARIEAHAVFDKLWTHNRGRRDLYANLAKSMGLSKSKCHIGMFDVEQCQKVIEFCEENRCAPTT